MDDPHDEIDGIPQRPARAGFCTRCQDDMETCNCYRDKHVVSVLVPMIVTSIVVLMMVSVVLLVT